MNIVDILGKSYNEINYSILVRDLFKNVTENKLDLDISQYYKKYIKNSKMLASFVSSDDKKLAILAIKVSDNSRARTLQRNYVSILLTNGILAGYDAALVAFYDDVRPNWKLALITIDYELTDSGISVIYNPAKRFSFLVGENEPSKTYMNQLKDIYESKSVPSFTMIKEAFSVNRITEDFYKDYCYCFQELSRYLLSSEDFKMEAYKLQYDDVKEFAITFTKKTLGQIVFLHFIQKKGWLGVPLDKKWGDGDKNYIFNTIKNEDYSNYFNDVLEPLFYKGLNCKRVDDAFKGYKVPFLNGGLFSPVENYDWENTNFNIPNSIWFNDKKNGFLDILMQYNFTVDESDPTEQDIAVDPEMLGKIFESLLDPEDRYKMGAHYTPREIVHYMCVETLAYNISNNLKLDNHKMYEYILYGNSLDDVSYISSNSSGILEFLKKITIVDPAVGSGAFLVGMLNEIVKLQVNLYLMRNESYDKYDLKKQVIQNSLYGVDIENDAIEIAKLRLWLSLIVEENSYDNSTPNPLPNLAFHLCVGNSLVDEYHGVKIWENKFSSRKKTSNIYKGYNLFNVMDYDAIMINLKAAKESFFAISDEKEKKRLYNEISKFQLELIKNVLFNKGEQDLFDEIVEMQKKRTKPFFLWTLEFDRVFQQGGFDIVIANPPYLKERGNSKIFAPVNESSLGRQYHCGKMDFWYYFLHLAILISNKKGQISFITPRYWINSTGARNIIKNVKEELIFNSVLDIGKLRVFDDVVGYHMVSNYSKIKNTDTMIYKKVNIDLNNLMTLSSNENVEMNRISNEDIFVNNEIVFDTNRTNNKTSLNLGNVANVCQGIVEACDRISKKSLSKNNVTGYSVGEGIFVLDEDELTALNLNSYEKGCIHNYLRGEAVGKYSIKDSKEYVIYSDNIVKNLIANNPNYANLKKHLDRMKPFITSSNAPYGLHRPRKKECFLQNKILVPSMFKDNNFAIDYNNRIVGMSFSVVYEPMDGFKLEYILACLNSRFAYKWFYDNGKHRGVGVDIGVDKLKSFPIVKPSEEIQELLCKLVEQQNKNYSIDVQNEIDNIVEKIYNN